MSFTLILFTGPYLTGLSFRRDIAKGIYSQIEGAKLVNLTNDGPAWVVPCDKEVNITFKFGGKPFIIDPLDATWPHPELNDSMCMGTVIY